MIALAEISPNELRRLIELSYTGDMIGLRRYHIQEFELPQAINCTMMMIEKEAERVEFSYYSIKKDETPIGYVVVSGGLLYSFAIKMGYRTKAVLLSWWEAVKKIMPQEFFALLYENNTRAINFLKRRGMTVIHTDETTSIVTLKYILCQQQFPQ